MVSVCSSASWARQEDAIVPGSDVVPRCVWEGVRKRVNMHALWSLAVLFVKVMTEAAPGFLLLL